MRRVAALGARRRHRMRSGSGGSVAGARLRYVHVAAHDVAGVNSLLAAKGGDAGYEMVESDEATFFPGRQAFITRGGENIGTLGIVHPDVLQKFDIVNPCSILELDLEPLLDVGRSDQ